MSRTIRGSFRPTSIFLDTLSLPPTTTINNLHGTNSAVKGVNRFQNRSRRATYIEDIYKSRGFQARVRAVSHI